MARIDRAVPEDGLLEALPGIFLVVFQTNRARCIPCSIPRFCIIAQGSKQVLLGERSIQIRSGALFNFDDNFAGCD